MGVSQSVRSYIDTISETLEHADLAAVTRVVELLAEARQRESTIFLAGNGGSAATASHWVNDLNKATKGPGVPPMRALNLTDNVSWFTAVANDEGYERIFSAQLENLARPGDVLAVISASGNSPNLLAAVEQARALGVDTFALLGFDGGRLRGEVDVALWVETDIGAYGIAESVHSLLCDIITQCLQEAADGARQPV